MTELPHPDIHWLFFEYFKLWRTTQNHETSHHLELSFKILKSEIPSGTVQAESCGFRPNPAFIIGKLWKKRLFIKLVHKGLFPNLSFLSRFPSWDHHCNQRHDDESGIHDDTGYDRRRQRGWGDANTCPHAGLYNNIFFWSPQQSWEKLKKMEQMNILAQKQIKIPVHMWCSHQHHLT